MIRSDAEMLGGKLCQKRKSRCRTRNKKMEVCTGWVRSIIVLTSDAFDVCVDPKSLRCLVNC